MISDFFENVQPSTSQGQSKENFESTSRTGGRLRKQPDRLQYF